MVWPRGHSDHVSADRTTGPRPILDHEALPDLLADLLASARVPAVYPNVNTPTMAGS
jgi:hypothetical protein